jgi:two-component sensor histidine kinase
VKNNLQIISSLFNLQIMHGGRGTEDIFRTAQGRIQSMALVHERLYQTENLSAVPFDDYMRRISEDLISTYSVQERVSLRIESEPIYLPLDTAIPLGLIVNEIITNSLKHAFGDDLAGTITVSFQEVSGECRLLICDTGEGFADNAHSAEERLGLKLISTLAGQIRGSVEFPPTDQGACLLVRFPYPDK